MLHRLRAVLLTDPLIVLATIVMGSISFVTSLADSTGRAQHAVARAWARILLWVSGVRVTVEGLEKLDPHGSYVFAPIHRSYMDTPVVLASIPHQFRFLAKRSLFQIPFLGTHLRRAGHIPVPLEEPRALLQALTAGARVLREKGISVLVFPEGGRTMGQLEEFRNGAAYLAIKAGVPVAPVVLEGTFEVLPMTTLLVRGGPVRMRFLDPIPTAGLAVRDHARLTRELRERIAAALG